MNLLYLCLTSKPLLSIKKQSAHYIRCSLQTSERMTISVDIRYHFTTNHRPYSQQAIYLNNNPQRILNSRADRLILGSTFSSQPTKQPDPSALAIKMTNKPRYLSSSTRDCSMTIDGGLKTSSQQSNKRSTNYASTKHLSNTNHPNSPQIQPCRLPDEVNVKTIANVQKSVAPVEPSREHIENIRQILKYRYAKVNDEQEVTLEKDHASGIGIIRIKSAAKNGISPRMMCDLLDTIDELYSWPQGKGVLIYGHNGFFCSGGDLISVRELANYEDGLKLATLMQYNLTRLQSLPMITLSLIQGSALGGGAELAVTTDLRLMTKSSRLGYVDCRAGSVAAWGGGSRLVQLIGSSRAVELMSSGRLVEADEALSFGLINSIIDDSNLNDEQILAEAKKYLSSHLIGADPAIVAIKSLVNGARTLPLEQIVRQPAYYEPGDSFRASDLVTLPCSPAEMKPKPSIDQLLFGHFFTDHMFQVEWDHERGWSTPLITKVHNLEVHPGSKVLHYAVQAFEGAKAFRGFDNRIRFFRLDANIKRLLRSSRRLALPDFDELELMRCIHKLVHLDQDWIPELTSGSPLTSLYIRPTIMGIEPSLGVASSRKSLLYVLLSPVGPYFKTGFKPVTLYTDPDFVRAWPGGAGHAKLGANYAPTIMLQKQAEKLGLQQVLWLYDTDMKLTEVGTMNIFVSIKNPQTGKIHLVTPPLTDGIILPGITRDSIIKIARQWDDVVVEERYVTIGELQQLIHEERLIEVFGSGTACIVCPINGIQMKDGTKIKIPFTDVTKENNDEFIQEKGTFLTKRVLKAITDIQYGRIPHPWAQELIEQ
uniref:Branched-chain-amino-acid aminotransferase n=1 Tax=Aceria tosichella TaxID=561515 RepID=A0A6G1S5M1_9ACAR